MGAINFRRQTTLKWKNLGTSNIYFNLNNITEIKSSLILHSGINSTMNNIFTCKLKKNAKKRAGRIISNQRK